MEFSKNTTLEERLYNTKLRDIKNTMQIRDREFSVTEKRYVESWIANGFGVDAIKLACDISYVKTEKITWSYVDRVRISSIIT